ncbi:MAG: LTA synthase family protein [Planctomycetes bacterium]|nr:LTA synthase family protein [Planctomycetota bacterium]
MGDHPASTPTASEPAIDSRGIVPLRPWVVPILPVAMAFAALSLGRLALWKMYPATFSTLEASAISAALLRGLIFDASIIGATVAPAALMSALPLPEAARWWWRRCWGWAAFAAVVALVVVEVADLVYFGEVQRHVGAEAFAAGNDLDLVVAHAITRWPVATFALLALAAAAWGWKRVLARPERPWGIPPWLGTAVAILVIGLVVVAIRGGVTRKPVAVINAMEGTTAAGGYLTLNGPFVLSHTVGGARAVPAYLPPDEALGLVRDCLVSDRDRSVSSDYPILRAHTPPTVPDRKLNVVVLLLESWDATQVDASRVAAGLEPLGTTPRFDALCREGVFFTRFYANGQRSLEGISSTLAGMPVLPGLPFLGQGMELSPMRYLGMIARENGCSTSFMQGSRRSSLHVDAIASLAGFDSYAGASDIQVREPRPARFGAWDSDLLAHCNDTVRAAARPTCSVAFTLTTHGPCEVPEAKWQRFSGEPTITAFRDSLHFADAAVGRFMDRAKSDGWFADTVFVLLGDHTSFFPAHQGMDPEELHHIPCLIIAPGLTPGVSRRVGSQADLLPTIMDLAGWSGAHTALGRSLFDDSIPDGDRWAACAEGMSATWIGDRGWVSALGERRLSTSEGLAEDSAADYHRRLLALQQIANALMRSNRVAPP